jgi:hypothetical protein
MVIAVTIDISVKMHTPSKFDLLDVAETGECRDEPVYEGAEDQEEEQLEPTHIITAHTLPDEDTVVVVVIYTHVTHVAVLGLWLGGDRTLMAEVPEGLTIVCGTWDKLEGCWHDLEQPSTSMWYCSCSYCSKPSPGLEKPSDSNSHIISPQSRHPT